MIVQQIQEFASTLPTGRRLLGLDLGEKTIGLALSDAGRMIATPMETLARSAFKKDSTALKAIIDKHQIGGLVIGYPINMDGTLGPRTQSTRQFAQNFEKLYPLPVLLWDERMSTMAVTRTMMDADLSRQRRAELVDKMAASYILQGVLDIMARG